MNYKHFKKILFLLALVITLSVVIPSLSHVANALPGEGYTGGGDKSEEQIKKENKEAKEKEKKEEEKKKTRLKKKKKQKKK